MIQFRGTRKEFGEYYGLRLKEFQHNFFRHTNADTLRRQLKIYEKFYPELVQEKLAAAEILHQDPQYLLYEDLAAPVDAQHAAARINIIISTPALSSQFAKIAKFLLVAITIGYQKHANSLSVMILI